MSSSDLEHHLWDSGRPCLKCVCSGSICLASTCHLESTPSRAVSHEVYSLECFGTNMTGWIQDTIRHECELGSGIIRGGNILYQLVLPRDSIKTGAHPHHLGGDFLAYPWNTLFWSLRANSVLTPQGAWGSRLCFLLQCTCGPLKRMLQTTYCLQTTHISARSVSLLNSMKSNVLSHRNPKNFITLRPTQLFIKCMREKARFFYFNHLTGHFLGIYQERFL